jgi:deoxycytidylate deaminase
MTGRGYNTKKTHARMNREFGFTSLHAECSALMRAKCGDKLIVVRLLKNDDLSCSKPCDKCMKYIKKQGIKEIYYINWDGELVSEKVK